MYVDNSTFMYFSFVPANAIKTRGVGWWWLDKYIENDSIFVN